MSQLFWNRGCTFLAIHLDPFVFSLLSLSVKGAGAFVSSRLSLNHRRRDEETLRSSLRRNDWKMDLSTHTLNPVCTLATSEHKYTCHRLKPATFTIYKHTHTHTEWKLVSYSYIYFTVSFKSVREVTPFYLASLSVSNPGVTATWPGSYIRRCTRKSHVNSLTLTGKKTSSFNQISRFVQTVDSF